METLSETLRLALALTFALAAVGKGISFRLAAATMSLHAGGRSKGEALAALLILIESAAALLLLWRPLVGAALAAGCLIVFLAVRLRHKDILTEYPCACFGAGISVTSRNFLVARNSLLLLFAAMAFVSPGGSASAVGWLAAACLVGVLVVGETTVGLLERAK